MSASIMPFLNKIRHLPTARVWVAGMALLAILGWFDWYTRSELGLSVFYVIPIALITWCLGSRAGMLACGMAAIIWYIAECHSWQQDPRAIVFWNTGIRLATFTLISFLINQVQTTYESLLTLTQKDGLTGINNWRSFQENLEVELARQSRHRYPMTLVFIDVDNFKQVNDQWGHQRGDDLLRAIAHRLTQSVRTGDLISRIGGDEFTILMPHTDQQQAAAVMRRLHPQLQSIATTEQLPVGFSIGVATYAQAPPTGSEMVAIADKLMYQAKQAGKNRVVYQVF